MKKFDFNNNKKYSFTGNKKASSVFSKYRENSFGDRGNRLNIPYDRNGDSKDVIKRVTELAKELLEIWRSDLPPDKIANRYMKVINNNGFLYLGRGQNRIAFMNEGSAWVYKVPFREIGFRDNAIERFCTSLIADDKEAYRELAPHMPLVTDFALHDDFRDFMICMEYIDDLVGSNETDNNINDAIYACTENIDALSDLLRKFGKYFHMVDVHPILSAMNYGVKQGNLAIRDMGYFVPRIGDLSDITVDINGKEYSMAYYTLDSIPLTQAEKDNVYKRIQRYSDIAESWCPVDSNGRYIAVNDGQLYDAADCIDALLNKFEQEILD